jgi:Xaa-Pro aminopeptidase
MQQARMEINSTYALRLKKVENVMTERGVRCILLNQSKTIEYLTGAANTCSWVFITNDGRQIALVLESDFREYQKQTILEDVRSFTPHDPLQFFRSIPPELGIADREIAFEKDHLRFSQFEMVAKSLGPRINLEVDADQIVQKARLTKTPDEIEAIRRAAQLAAFGIQVAREAASPGMTEAGLAEIICEAMIERGAGNDSYVYLASGERSSLAHAHPAQNRLGSGPVVIDVHSSFAGFHADVARTLFLDASLSEPRARYSFFKDRVLDTIQTLRSGVSLVEVKRRFYSGLKEAEDCILLTGPLLHGVGILNYELPRFDHPFEGRGYPPNLAAGMVLACTNIGMYSKKGWGIRYEDTLTITRENPELLTQLE